jgi:hypothetical protein
MINDHGLHCFKIIPGWFQKPLPPERGWWSARGAERQ